MKGREAFQEVDYKAVFGTMVKWAAGIDQVDRDDELTGLPVFGKKTHGKTPQRRIQTSGRAGIHGWRNAAWSGKRHDVSPNLSASGFRSTSKAHSTAVRRRSITPKSLAKCLPDC
ncbi:hypothetical protein AGR7C_pAt0122 [Agrobacterium deltaense Zutra 3/1]|uniref:Uncharacterized protein n=1 Tax=Agrobacterium deltaense Zutra 3/1 TaxID=1183427 RepID=A0A1S7S3G5_9HYPH|nr:hypothetical protein AGR7C_pAt0122 [Agrobacterium deltaense Zutra 3/1]